MSNKSILDIAKNMSIKHNVSFNVYDEISGKLIKHHQGHNMATNSLLTGIGHYLTGDGVLNQAWETLRYWVPQYISLGTMGLTSQECNSEGLPTGLGSIETDDEELMCIDYMNKIPGYGADGYDKNLNNLRTYLGLGPTFANRPDPNKTINCELISTTYPRVAISYREIVPEYMSELPKTIDVVFSAMISTGALKQFRESGKDYIFITEAGLWSDPDWHDGGDNGLLAGYRIAPPSEDNWDMTVAENRKKLKQEILRVGYNQVVQVIWKIQLGSITEYGGWGDIINALKWIEWDEATQWGNLQDWPGWEGPNDNSPKNNILTWKQYK